MRRGRAEPIVAAFLAGALIAEGPLAHRFSLWGATPALLLTCVYCSALFSGRVPGAAMGFLVGIVHAALAGGVGAPFLISGTVSGFMAGWAPRFVSPQHWAVGPLVVLACSLVAKGLFLLLSPQQYLGNWVQLTMIGSVYNAVLSVPMYLLLVRAKRVAREH